MAESSDLQRRIICGNLDFPYCHKHLSASGSASELRFPGGISARRCCREPDDGILWLRKLYKVLADNSEVKASCVITDEGNGICEIKSIAVYPRFQRQGYEKKLIHFLWEHYEARCHTMLVGTGDSSATISFYTNCGFVYSHRIPNFFTDNYDRPIFEEDKQLKDMIYLKMSSDR